MKPDKIPAHIKGESRTLWKQLAADYDLSDAAGAALLRVACEAHARAEEARKILAVQGLTCLDRHRQLKSHPCVQTEKNARTQMIAAIRAMRLAPGN